MTAGSLFAQDTPRDIFGPLTFEVFWSAWPADHRVGRKQAADQWNRLKAQDRTKALDELAWRVANDRRWQGPAEDGRWAIPHPFRWLRDRRFEDARPTTAPRPAITTDIRRRAMDIRTRAWGGCRHEPRCETFAECVELIAAEIIGGGR